MTWLMRGVTTAFDAIFAPLAWVSPVVGLMAAGLVTAILALLVVKRTSNQARVRRAKDGMYAALLEMRLFNDDIAAVFRAQWDVIRYNGRYLAAALVPMLWLVIPFGLVVAELDAFYASDGLLPNQPALLTAHVREGQTITAGDARLVVPDGIGLESPAIWFPATRDVVWRLTPAAAGHYTVVIETPAEKVSKTVVVSNDVTRRSPSRGTDQGLSALEPASEPPLEAASVFDAITVTYPSRDLDVLGWHVPWFVIYGTFVIVFGFALSRVFHVEI